MRDSYMERIVMTLRQVSVSVCLSFDLDVLLFLFLTRTLSIDSTFQMLGARSEQYKALRRDLRALVTVEANGDEENDSDEAQMQEEQGLLI